MADRRRVRNVVVTTLGILAVLCMAVPVQAQGGYRLETLGTCGGRVEAVQVEGDLAYVAAGRRLVILDISDLSNPTELGSIDLGTWVHDLSVRDGYAFVGAYYLRVVDISNPAAPQLIWSDDNGFRRRVMEVDLYGNVAYVEVLGNLKTFDISDPENPVYHGEPISGGIVADTTVVGDLMYMATTENAAARLRIYDLAADPPNPTLLVSTFLHNGVGPKGIDVEGDYACVTASGVLVIVNISDPEAPFVMGSWQGFFFANDVAVSNGFAYVADWQDGAEPWAWNVAKGLAIFDLTDPSNPTLVNTYKTHGSVWGVEVVGTTAYLFDEGEGLIMLDLSDPVNPVRLGNYHSPTELRKMAKVGDLLYVTDEWNGITILDVSDPVRPTPVGVYQTPQDGYHMAHWGLEVRDGLAYLAAGYGQLQAVDVGDPANPVLLGTGEFLTEYHAIGLELWGDIANVGYGPPSGSNFRFVNFDIRDLQNIVPVGDVYVGSPLLTIDTTPGGIAFTARSSTGGGTLTTLDTSDPNDPFVIYGGQPGGVDLVRDENLLYLANASSDEGIGGLYIVDVGDPTNPVGYWQPPTSGNKGLEGVALTGELAIVTHPPGRTLYVLDVSDPAQIGLVTELHVPGARFVLADGRYVYVTGYDSGLTIFELEGLSPPGDLNGDGCVDQADLGILLADWNCTGGDCPGDADGDGDTDHADLGTLLADWGEGC